MIARVWQGKTRLEHSDIYTKIIEERDMPNYRKTHGFVKLSFLKRSDDEFTYFKLLTYWSDLDAITNFTGPNYDEPKFYDDDAQYLVDFPGSVSHYEVFAS
ncbi:MAG: antibiotic biosynthesis monooxygenase [Winogradskyella sp.]|uniref:antibiotic biosynthesis monooxygenase n=1 Tax=Winogradskyella sp. TaxID=1883156 RepID=UPI000F41C1C5|nr:antibiotic biosynthesis monooxygenase [Winogradskyella sp.]RNC87087.1 MAG: antibiotic biosynthesis monooxygenase [Winogradskyella sp.]